MNNQTINDLNNRKLDPCLFSIIIFPSNIYFKQSDDIITHKEIYIIFSCNISGVRKFIDIVFKDDFSKTSSWYDYIISLKSRGINTILFAVIPNNDLLSKALKLSFNEIEIFISCFETINKLSKYYTISYTSHILESVRKIFLSNSNSDYEVAMNDFKEDFLIFPFISDLLEEDLKRAKKYNNIDYEIRNFIFSFYFYRDMSKRLHVISRSKPYFLSLDEFTELLLIDIQRIEARMFCPKNKLKDIINILYNSKKELIKPYL